MGFAMANSKVANTDDVSNVMIVVHKLGIIEASVEPPEYQQVLEKAIRQE